MRKETGVRRGKGGERKGVAARSRILSRQAKIHLKVAYYYCLFFPITVCATRVLSKPRKISDAYKTPAGETRRPNNMRTYRLKFPIIFRFLKRLFVANVLDIYRFRKCE